MRHLPSLFVALLSAATATLGVLFWQSQQANAELKASNASLLADVEEQVATLDRENDQLHRQIIGEVENEIENMGKPDNQGLLDTLPMIRQETHRLLTDSLRSAAEVEHWGSGLTTIFNGNIRDPQRRAYFSLGQGKKLAKAQQALLLLRWEKEVLQLLHERVGIACRWGMDAQLFWMPASSVQMKVVAGDEFQLYLM